MNDANTKKFQKDLNSGLVALVLMAVLAATDEDAYGYDIAKRLLPPGAANPCSRKARSIPC